MGNLFISNLIHEIRLNAEKFCSDYSYVDGNEYLDNICYQCRVIIDVCNRIDKMLLRDIPVFYDDSQGYPIFIWSEDENHQRLFRPKDGLQKEVERGQPFNLIDGWKEM